MIAKDERDLLRAGRAKRTEQPIAVPPDQAPLRQQGDLLGTLERLRESYGTTWILADVATYGTRHSFIDRRRSELVGQLIATAIQQAEALPKPEGGDLAAWREKAMRLASSADDWLTQFLHVPENDWSKAVAAHEDVARLRDHLAAMPAPPDVNTGLLKAAMAASSAVNDYASVCPLYEREVIATIRDELRAAIDAAEKGAAK